MRRGDLWTMAGVGPGEVDVAQLYDAFTPLVLGSLEEYGFCKPGEAGAFVENGGLEVGGNLPNNTSGGSLSEAYVHGINLIIEAVRQIRGTSCNQVPGRAAVARHQRQHGADRRAAAARGVSDGRRRRSSVAPAAPTGCRTGRPARRRELRFQRCTDCRRGASRPDRCVPRAARSRSEWALASGRGRLLSWVVCHPPLLPAWKERAPVRRRPGRMRGGRAHHGQPARRGRGRRCAWTCRWSVDFAPSPDGDLVPQWRPAG